MDVKIESIEAARWPREYARFLEFHVVTYTLSMVDYYLSAIDSKENKNVWRISNRSCGRREWWYRQRNGSRVLPARVENTRVFENKRFGVGFVRVGMGEGRCP